MTPTDERQPTATAKGDDAAAGSPANDVRVSLRRLQELIATRAARQLVAAQQACQAAGESRGP